MVAMRRAAAMARVIAIQTNTGIVVCRDGKPARITAQELRNEDARNRRPDMTPCERAKAARIELEQAILDYLAARPEGAINNEIARELGLESDFAGRQKNYLSYSLLGGLMTRGLIVREVVDGKKPFKKV